MQDSEFVAHCFLFGSNVNETLLCESPDLACCINCLGKKNKQLADSKNNIPQGSGNEYNDYIRLRKESFNHLLKSFIRAVKDHKCLFRKDQDGCLVISYLIDATAFKPFNDRLNYEVGDIVLDSCKQAVERLPEITNAGGHAYNYGGDEYMYFICDYTKCLRRKTVDDISKNKQTIDSFYQTSNFKLLLEHCLKDFKKVNIHVAFNISKDKPGYSYFSDGRNDISQEGFIRLFEYRVNGIEFHIDESRNDNMVVDVEIEDDARMPSYINETTEALDAAYSEAIERRLKSPADKATPRGYFSKDVKLYIGDEIVLPNHEQIYFIYTESEEISQEVFKIVQELLGHAYRFVVKSILSVLHDLRRNGKAGDKIDELDEISDDVVSVDELKNTNLQNGTFCIRVKLLFKRETDNPIIIKRFNEVIDIVEKGLLKDLIQKNKMLCQFEYKLFTIKGICVGSSAGNYIA